MMQKLLSGRLSAGVGGVLFLLLASAGYGCGPSKPATHPVVKKAMFDLDCPRKGIKYTEIDDETIGVSGCGKRTKYLKVCRLKPYGQESCTWVEN